MSAPLGNEGVSYVQKGTSSNAAIGTTGVTVFTLLPGQVGQIQNLAAVALYVKYGAGCTTSSFSFILPACAVALDGTSPPVFIDCWLGAVSVVAASGTASYLATVLS